MIKPVNFGFNAETAVNNAFQRPGHGENSQEKALNEFNAFVQTLRDHGVQVTVIEDSVDPYTPDSIFPNNWISFHDDGVVCLYPMYAQNRRLERKPGTIKQIAAQFQVKQTIDFSNFEQRELFLEGTGSMVLDRENKIAYACLSPRTDKKVLDLFCDQLGYKAVTFDAVDGSGKAIYHTNVMMCIADQYAVVCVDAIPKSKDKQLVAASIKRSGKELIEISLGQMNHFAGNMLQVKNEQGEPLLVMSSQAFKSLTQKQIKKLTTFNQIVHSPLDTIETNGGGSARCMMAEVFLQPKNS